VARFPDSRIVRRSVFPDSRRNPVTAQGPKTEDQFVANRLQWRDRVGFSPTSHGRRGERQIVFACADEFGERLRAV
jgi:hypothetical protein